MNLPWKSSSGTSLLLSSSSSSSSSKQYKNKLKLKYEKKFFTIDDNRECLAMFFRFINDEVKNMKCDISTTLTSSSSSLNKKKSILFCIENGDINYLVTFGEGAQFIQLKSIDQYTPNCIVILDSYIMTKLARGVLKPMSAILGGQLKIEGDTKTFGEFTPILRASVKAMMEHNKTNFNLDVSILRTYEKTDETGNRHTEYVIRSIDRIGGNYWETPHRFSDFVNFRKLLASRGYQNLPDLPRKHIIHSSVNPNVVRRRMEDLALFLQLVIIQIGSSEPHVVNFLGAYMTGTTQTISQLPIPSQKKQNDSPNETSLESEHVETGDGSVELDGEVDDADSFAGSSLHDVVQMKHALKIAQEHAEYYVHETGRKYSVTSASLHSASFSIAEGESKSIDGSAPPHLSSILNFTPSASVTNNSRTNTVRNEIFQLKRRIDQLEVNTGDEQSISAYMASWCLHFLPRVTRWGTIMSLILGVAIPMLATSSQRIAVAFHTFLGSGIHFQSLLFLVSGTAASFSLYVFSCFMIIFIISMPLSRIPAGIALVMYVTYPLLAPFIGLMLQILQEFVGSPQNPSPTQFCGIGVYLPDRETCSYSPTRIIINSLTVIGLKILTREGICTILITWLISIPITYSLHTMKNYGVKVFPAHPLTSILRYIMICERLFSIYTPIATVVSAYIYLSLFLKVFGYATPALISGTETSDRKLIFDHSQRSLTGNNKNLTSSAYHALDRVLAEYVLNEISSLKSIFIKVGQYIAGRPDLVSSLWSTTLSKLHDGCPTSSSLYVKTLVESCLTISKNRDDKKHHSKQKLFYQNKNLRSLDELFETFDMKPIASGCVAQYHQATMFIDGQLYDVIVKVQHPTIETLFEIDMSALKTIVTIATKFYSKWTPLLDVIKVWENSLKDELDFRLEAQNMIEAHQDMQKSGFGACVPEPVRGYIHQKVLVTTRLRGFKITDKFSLTLHCVDTSSLICRVAHSLAYQMLVAGFFHADPHPGNIFCVEGRPSEMSASPSRKRPVSAIDQSQYYLDSPSSLDDSWRPGFLDFGMTHRLKDETRLLYCKLLISLQEEDAEGVAKALSSLGYVTNQSDRSPERDQEFFEFLFRDANDVKSAHIERKLFNDMRSAQQAEDATLTGNKERSQRVVYEIPNEYFFISRTVGLLRGLSAIMNVRCPIIEIFTLQARIGIHQRNEAHE